MCGATAAVEQAIRWSPRPWWTECSAVSKARTPTSTTRRPATSLRERRRPRAGARAARTRTGQSGSDCGVATTSGWRLLAGNCAHSPTAAETSASTARSGWASAAPTTPRTTAATRMTTIARPNMGSTIHNRRVALNAGPAFRYTGPVYALGLAVRWTHLACSVLLVGSAMTIAIAGRSDRPTALRWEQRLLAWSRVWALVALVSGLAQLGLQTALFEGRAMALLEAPALARVLFETQVGRVWLVRHRVLVLLSAFLLLPLDVARRADWRAARGEAVLLGAVALVPIAASGHAAAVEPGTAIAIAVDGAHLLAAGAWAGGLLPLPLLLRPAGPGRGAGARPYPAPPARRFSRCALAAIVALALLGAGDGATQGGSVAGLVGTPYGRLLLLKLGVLIPALALAALDRAVHLPRLSGHGLTVGPPAMPRLAEFVVGEGVLALGILGAVAAMGATPPALHDAPVWPFSFRLSL